MLNPPWSRRSRSVYPGTCSTPSVAPGMAPAIARASAARAGRDGPDRGDDVGDSERGASLLDEATRLARAAGDSIGIAGNLNQLAIVALREGRAADAGPWMEEAVALLRDAGDMAFLTRAIHTQGHVALATGQLGLAEACFRESLRMRVQQRWEAAELGNCLEGLAAVAHRRGRPEGAARPWGATDAMWGGVVPASLRWREAERDRTIAEMRAALGEERFASRWEAGRVLT